MHSSTQRYSKKHHPSLLKTCSTHMFSLLKHQLLMSCSHTTGERNQVLKEQVKRDGGGVASNS